MKTHWLHGRGPEKIVEFNVEIDVEHQCSKCIHGDVCKRNMPDFCWNYWFGSSTGCFSCQGCTHKYTRYDNKDPLPCFCCKHYVEAA